MLSHSLYFFERRYSINKVTLQEWLPYDEVLEDGIINCKSKFIKILKVIPISYELKSDFEKETILEAYKLFLRSCNFDIQILIQSKKENIEDILGNVQIEKFDFFDFIREEYISFIKNLNSNQKLLSKNFFILLSLPKETEINKIRIDFVERISKIKETLSKCGNEILEIKEKEEVIEVIDSFLNPYKSRR